MAKLNEIGFNNDLISIQYVPKTGKNKGIVYTQYYKGDKYNLFAWLSDVTEERDGKLYKKTLQGTYWNYTAGTKNLTKEGGVQFPNGKKPESLISRILNMCTSKGDIVLDSFLGSGTTAAVAHKMNRRWIGIEMGDQAYNHCKVRLDKIIDGNGYEHQEYIHFNKRQNTYEWQEQPDGFYMLPEKIEWIKNNGLWQKVRDRYLNNKNTNSDPKKKSRSIFAETIAQIYNENSQHYYCDDEDEECGY